MTKIVKVPPDPSLKMPGLIEQKIKEKEMHRKARDDYERLWVEREAK